MGESNNAGAGAQVLIVDDERPIVRLAQRVLESSGYAVATAFDAQSALAILEAESSGIRVVLTDLKMPGSGGAELARDIREKYPDIHLIIMSGVGNLSAIAAEIGEDVGSITKPFNVNELRTAVQGALDRG